MQRFLDVGDTKIPNFEFICVDICWDIFFLNVRPSFTKFLNCVSPISSIYLIRSNIKSRTTIESLFILCSFVDMNGSISNPLDSVLMSNSKFLQKMSLSSWCLAERALLVNGFPSDSSNSVMILAMSGPYVSQRINNESSHLLNKSVAHQLIWLPCFVRANSLFVFWKEKNLS